MKYTEFKREYETARLKYKLPDFKQLISQFDVHFTNLEFIPKGGVVLVIRRRMQDRLSYILGMLQGIVSPDGNSFIALNETKFFSDAEKESIVRLIRSLMFYFRKSSVLDIKTSPEKDAEFIKEVAKFWDKEIEDLLPIFTKLRDGWNITETEESGHYFG
ncbi:MAG: hypothetical protein AABW49_04735 [Nanoarchaeota archaeon]